MSRNDKIIIVVVISLALIGLCCVCLLGVSVAAWQGYKVVGEQAGFLIEEESPPAHTEIYQAVTVNDWETVAALEKAEPDIRDKRALAMRLQGIYNVPEVVRTTPYERAVGDRETFWVMDMETEEYFEAEAVLRHISKHAYFWVAVAEDEDVAQEDLEQAARDFDRVYERDRELFGAEWSPGVDSDPRVHIYNGKVPGVGGYFSSADETPRVIDEYSNEREMFYINIETFLGIGYVPGEDDYVGVLAHEFQHMIHWNIDRNETTWVNEGLAELAMHLNGYDAGGSEDMFAWRPDTQLTTWQHDPSRAVFHYGAAYLFLSYYHQLFGDAALRELVATPEDGMVAFDAVLADAGMTGEELFKDWVIANYLNNPMVAERQYAYEELDIKASTTETHEDYPAYVDTAVHQFAADYVEFLPDYEGDLYINFRGAPRTRLVATTPPSGDYLWYANRCDDCVTNLTRAFDLSETRRATLSFWTWYAIEEDWDYGYVEVSTDGGETWTILEGTTTTTSDPHGNAFGPGYTGISGNGDAPTWIREEVSLNAYAGQRILVRFEHISDDAVNTPGWAIDDVAIPEIGYTYDVENGDGDWKSVGFVRTTNFLPQRFAVQIIREFRDGAVDVWTAPLIDENHGDILIPNFGAEVKRVVMVVSGLAPVTTEWAYYEYAAELR